MRKRVANAYRRSASEEAIHAGIVSLLRVKADSCTIWHHPMNGVPSTPATIARFKKLGMRPGVADLCLTLPGGRSAYLEVKTERGRQSLEQRAFQIQCEIAGVPYAIARSLTEADAILEGWGAYRARPMRRAA